jgi:hypothetical protein
MGPFAVVPALALYVMAFKAVVVLTAVAVGALLVGLILQAVLSPFPSGKPVKTTHHGKDVWGNRLDTVTHHDTGRVLQYHQVGDTTYTLEKVPPRRHKRVKPPKKCWACHTWVLPDARGSYACCNHTFY